MTKKHKIIYWIATIWLALGMASTGIVQIIQMDAEVENFTTLGYPTYLLTLVGIAKILGVVVLLMPKAPLLKEWAYAGFFFTMSGAIISHIASSDQVNGIFGPLLLLVLTLLSWYFRPADRRMIAMH